MSSYKQNKMTGDQVEAFFDTEFEGDQVKDFESLLEGVALDAPGTIVDVGGGVGRFAQIMVGRRPNKVRVIDIDEKSIEVVKSVGSSRIEGIVADALDPPIFGDEAVVTINLILHHLVGASESATLALQEAALTVWKGKVEYIFINEYIYESFVKNLSGKLIYAITSSVILSSIGALVGKFVPSLMANTFGVGVRFRSDAEWRGLFVRCGFEVLASKYGKEEFISAPRRLLLISQIRRNSYLLRATKN